MAGQECIQAIWTTSCKTEGSWRPPWEPLPLLETASPLDHCPSCSFLSFKTCWLQHTVSSNSQVQYSSSFRSVSLLQTSPGNNQSSVPVWIKKTSVVEQRRSFQIHAIIVYQKSRTGKHQLWKPRKPLQQNKQKTREEESQPLPLKRCQHRT